jgi:hypothetical protein
MKELIDLIRAAPDKYNYAGLGIGFGQLSAERLFKLGLKLDGLARVPFQRAAPAVNRPWRDMRRSSSSACPRSLRI